VRDARQDVHTDELGLRGQIRDTPPPSRWSLSTAGVDAFWPVLGVVLVVAVIFVASVAHSSMDSVGVPVSQAAAQQPKPVSSPGPLQVVVQVSSHRTRSAALAASQELIGRGFRTQVLDSDDYRGLNGGYYVVYIGPYPVTSAGRADAKRVQDRLPGALVRDIHAR
jgi:hypothetical protein